MKRPGLIAMWSIALAVAILLCRFATSEIDYYRPVLGDDRGLVRALFRPFFAYLLTGLVLGTAFLLTKSVLTREK